MASEAGYPGLPFQEIIKWDRFGKNRQVWSARHEFGVVGEAVFVPKRNFQQQDEEDDGWVITQLYNCKKHLTQFVILDAKHIDKGPIARLSLNHHTPYGFHGTFAHEIF